MNTNYEGLNSEQTESFDKTEELVQFLNNLASEYENRMNDIAEKRQETYNILIELKEKLLIISQTRSNKADIFSPNIRFDESNKISNDINELNEKLIQLDYEKDKLSKTIYNLNLTEKLLADSSIRNKFGLNILKSQEEDRQRIARDLHDSTVQNLTSLVHKIELCTRLTDLDQVRAKLELSAMSNTVKSVINEMREIIYNLKPMSLDDLGLIATIERYTKHLMINNEVKIFIKHNREREDILPVINLSLFRVVQEACNNIIKHASATRIDIDINYSTDRITLSVKDNGKGFDIEKQKNKLPEPMYGYGLSIMSERIYLLSGSLEIHSEINKGTVINLSVPIKKCEGEKNEQTN